MSLITLAVIVATVLFSYNGFKDSAFRQKYLFSIAGIQAGQQYRMLTSGFLHADKMHLFFNMFSLYMFGPLVEENFGLLGFLVIYIGSLLIGSIVAFMLHKQEPYYTALGASGAVTGMVYSAILLYPDMRMGLLFLPIPIPAYIFGILYLAFSIYGLKKNLGNIGHSAHLGGAIGGFGFTLLMMPELLQLHTNVVILLAIPMVVLYIMERRKS